MSKNKNISTPQVADPRDVKVGLISALFSILVLMILLFFITYEIANPLPKDEVVNAETIVGEILLEDLKIESGSIGGGSPSNDRVDKPKEQIQEIITGKSKRSSDKSGKSNKTNGNDANNEESTTVQSQNHFGSGGTGGKNGTGQGAFDRTGNIDDGDGNPGKGKKKNLKVKTHAVLPQYDIDYDSNIHLQLMVNANGEVVAAKSIKSGTTCSDQRIINQVVNEVIRQVKYYKENGAGLVYVEYSVKILAK